MGRSLADFAPLSSAEQRLLDQCSAAQPVSFGKDRPILPADNRRLRAGFVRLLALCENDIAPIHDRGLHIEGAWIEGDLDLDACKVPRILAFESCTISGKLLASEADLFALVLFNTRVRGIDGNGVRCGDFFFGEGSYAIEPVNLAVSRIDGDLVCNQARFQTQNGAALTLDRAEIKGGVFLLGCRSDGLVRLLGARINGNLEADQGRFSGTAEAGALDLSGATIDGSVYLRRGFRGDGVVRLIGTSIRGDLDCHGGRFEGKGKDALICSRARIQGSVFFIPAPDDNSMEFHATGAVNLTTTRIEGDLNCSGGRFESADLDDFALKGRQVEVRGALFFHDVRPRGRISFISAHVAILNDNLASWSAASALVLDDFRYDRISAVLQPDPNARGLPAEPPMDADSRIRWLNLQIRSHREEDFRPHPWQHLARALADTGHEEAAKRIRIEMRKKWRNSRWRYRQGFFEKARWWLQTRFDWLLGVLVGYGYRPWRPVWGFIAIWLLGYMLYTNIASSGVMEPADPRVAVEAVVPPECRLDWVTFQGPKVVTDVQRTADATRRDEVARAIKLQPANNPSWRDICRKAMPPQYSQFEPGLYVLDSVLPFLTLRQKDRWTTRVVDHEGHVIRRSFTLSQWLPLIGGSWGLGHLVRLWQWLSTLFLVFLSLLLAASVSGIIKKE